ncbi:MAG: phosphodiester glycosidase family protein, partial [Pyrinomonadaceae bacterium]
MKSPVGLARHPVQGLNRPPSADELIVFTPKFHRTTLTNPFSWRLNQIEPGDQTDWLRAYSMLGGGPQLIKAGKVAITDKQEKMSAGFDTDRHPRTAIVKLDSGKLLLGTVDGRQPGISMGMSLYMLTDLLLELGAIEAMNLDGGGPTTMVIHNKIVNKPSDQTGERPVSDAI